MLRHLILGSLRQGGAKHGYAVMKEIRDRAGLQVNIGNVYRELKRLEAEELVRSVVNAAGEDPRRAPFESTPGGMSAFDDWMASAPTKSLPDYRDEFCLRAIFIENVETAAARVILDRWREELGMHSRGLERCWERALAHRSRNVTTLPLFLARRIKHVATDLAFIEELRSAHEGWTRQNAEPSPRRPPGRGSRLHRTKQAAR